VVAPGVFLFDHAYESSKDLRELTEAGSREWLDQSSSGGVTGISPGGAIFGSDDAPLTIEVHDRRRRQPPRASVSSTPDRYVPQIWPRTRPAGVVRIRGCY
jgi:hypothetical protein